MADLPNTVNPLAWNVPIANRDGTPTNEFMRKWAQQAVTNGTIPALSTAAEVSAIIDILSAAPNDVLLRGGSEWGGASVSTLLDILGATEGDILVRGPSGWQVLAAGTATDVLTSAGPSALPAWAPSGGGGGGYAPGTVPAVVQTALSVNGGNSATFGTAPTNGNFLVAMCFNPANDSAGTGWAKVAENTSGTDYGLIFTKTAGAAESTTQSPISGVGGTGGIVIWEISGAGASPFVAGLSQPEQSGASNTPILLPNTFNCLGLSAVALVSGNTITAALGLGTQDVLDNSGTRCIAAGHTDLSKTPMVGVLAIFSGSGNSKGCTCLITS